MKGPPSPPPSSLPFPYSAMWLAHECQTTWQNMEMDTGKFRIYRILKGGKDTSPVEKYSNTHLRIRETLPLKYN